jgi:hypothetical protein
MLLMATLAICALPASSAFASGDVLAAWLAAYPDVCQDLVDAANDCSLCHTAEGVNPYGADLAAGDPLDPVAIEDLDSDDDGRTNGEEINEDCTLPGDPGSVPNDVVSWTQIKALFR